MINFQPDQESYNLIWEKIINTEIDNYERQYPGCISEIPLAKDEIWNEYIRLNQYTKINYMKNPEGLLDRHKVAACYMIAICNIRPMRFLIESEDILPLAINEKLAITVGFSLVRAFVVSDIEKKTENSSELKAKFDNGLYIPQEFINHGDYIDNYANGLRYACQDGKLCVLSLAHELFLLEAMTKMA